MTRRLIVRPAAVADIQEAYDWYEAEEEGVGEQFLDLSDAALEEILAAPYRFPLVYENRRRSF